MQKPGPVTRVIQAIVIGLVMIAAIYVGGEFIISFYKMGPAGECFAGLLLLVIAGIEGFGCLSLLRLSSW